MNRIKSALFVLPLLMLSHAANAAYPVVAFSIENVETSNVFNLQASVNVPSTATVGINGLSEKTECNGSDGIGEFSLEQSLSAGSVSITVIPLEIADTLVRVYVSATKTKRNEAAPITLFKGCVVSTGGSSSETNSEIMELPFDKAFMLKFRGMEPLSIKAKKT